MDESEQLFSLFYLLLCMCIIYPPEEFMRIGLTFEQIFVRILGDEKINFIRYHQRRTCLNLFVHSCLPAVYFIIHRFNFAIEHEKEIPEDLDPDFPMPQEAVAFKTLAWKVAQRCSLIAVLAVPTLIFNWWQQNWRRHPMSQTLAKYADNSNNFEEISNQINLEFRRNNVYKKTLNSITTVIATENWVIKTTLYNVYFAQQSDTLQLSVAKAETYNVSHDTNETLQMISIVVKPNREGVCDFNIRINALEFRNLEERINRPIVIPSNIQFHRNVIDRFVDVFREQVALNPIYIANRMTEKCFACMIVEPNIKINKQCLDVDGDGNLLTSDNCCTNCLCQPMWCVECLARWFAARQNEFDREVWLEKKCTCPMCRSKFCVLDVSYIQKRSENIEQPVDDAST